MLRLRTSVLTHLLSSSSAAFPQNTSLHRLLSATAAPRISPNPSFAVEDYLVDTCGLTRTQALRASAKLCHLKSPSNPDAVLAFLAGLGLSGADVAAAVVKDPQLLCAGVERTLAPVVVGLTGLGLSNPEIARLVPIAAEHFRRRSIVSKLQYYLRFLGSSENLFRALRDGSYLLTCSLDKVVKPNVMLLRECLLSDSDIAKLCVNVTRMLSTNPERVRAIVACAEGLGVPRGSGMFRQALQSVAFFNEEKLAAKVEYLKNTFRWSDAEVGIAVCKTPMLLRLSKEKLRHRSDFLISEVGLEPTYLAHRSIIVCLGLELRLGPRYYIVKFLKENRLLNRDTSYLTMVSMSERAFVDKFICPHKDATPHLAEDYAAACRGKVPARLMFA